MRVTETTDTQHAHLRELFATESDRIHGFLLLRTGSFAVAEDLTGDVFAAAARHCAEGRWREVTGAWLQTVAKRRLVDHWRRSTTRRRLTDRLVQRDQPLVHDDLHLDDAEEERVRTALGSLPDRQRAALCLRYLDEFSVSEVAEALDLGYQAAESLLARGRRSFIAAYESTP